jgi:hypothetical protein
MAVEDLQTLIDGYGDAFELIEDGKVCFFDIFYREQRYILKF